MTFGEIAAFSSFAVALTTLGLNVFDRGKTRIKELRDDLKNSLSKFELVLSDLRTRQEKMSGDLEVIKSQVAVFWRGVAFNGAMALHSPHTPDFDRLIEHFVADDLQFDEFERFKAMLHQVAGNSNETSFRRFVAQDVLLALYVQTNFNSVDWSEIDTRVRELRDAFLNGENTSGSF